MYVNANKIIDAMELLHKVAAQLDYCPDLYEVQRLLIESLKPASKIDASGSDADNADDELVEVTETGFGRILDKPTNKQFPE